MLIKKQIPNFITLMNLFSGIIAVVFALNSDYYTAFYFLLLGIVFDFFDGFVARLLNVSSNLGLQLDSLADMVTSGLVPGVVMYRLLLESQGIGNYHLNIETFFNAQHCIALIGFTITLASCYRLAKFNIDSEQKEEFKGLPTPANAILIVSTALIINSNTLDHKLEFLDSLIFLVSLTFISSYLLNSPVRLIALKFLNFSLRGNIFRYILIVTSICLFVILNIYALPIIIFFYILLSIIKTITSHD